MKKTLSVLSYFVVVFAWAGKDVPIAEEISKLQNAFSELSKNLTSPEDFSPVIEAIGDFVEKVQKVPYDKVYKFEFDVLDLMWQYDLLLTLRGYLLIPSTASLENFKELEDLARFKKEAILAIVKKTGNLWASLVKSNMATIKSEEEIGRVREVN